MKRVLMRSGSIVGRDSHPTSRNGGRVERGKELSVVREATRLRTSLPDEKDPALSTSIR